MGKTPVALPATGCACLLAMFAWASAAHAQCDRSRFRIVIDVGHTPQAYGALSARGKPEYAFNLSLSERIAAELGNSGFTRAFLMLSEGNGRQGLTSRPARANRMGADLFLSIHHDSVQDFYLDKWMFEGRKLAFSDRFHGYSLFVAGGNPHFSESRRYAAALADALQSRGLGFSAHHAENVRGEGRQLMDSRRGIYRFDQLVVLKKVRAAAVLLEAGIIVNRDEELRLAAPERQKLVAEAVAEATGAFCAANRAAEGQGKGP
jgi:N-acetylmuramoyl-L-alanine amidase